MTHRLDETGIRPKREIEGRRGRKKEIYVYILNAIHLKRAFKTQITLNRSKNPS